MLPMLRILRSDSLDLGSAPPQQHGMTPDILPLHLPRCRKELLAVAETNEPIPLALRRPLVADHAGLLDRWPPGEGFVERFIGDFARKIADEEAEMRRVPFQEGGIGPG